MFDNIYIKEKDAKCIIGFWNSFRIERKLKREIDAGNHTAQNYTFLASAYMARGELRKALQCVLKAIFIDKTYAYAYFIAGCIYNQVDEVSSLRAVKYFQKAIQYGGETYYMPIFELVRYYAAVQDNENRYKYEQMFLNIQSDDFGYFVRKTYLYLGWRDYSKVYKALKETFKAYRFYLTNDLIFLLLYFIVMQLSHLLLRDFEALDLAAYWLEVGNESDAVNLYFKLSQKNLRWSKWISITAYKALIDYFWDSGDYKKCFDITNRMLIKEKSAYAYYHKGISSYELDDIDSAIKYIDMAEKLDDCHEFSNYDYWRALCYASLYDLHNALKSINLALLQKKSSTNFMIKGQILREMNRYDEANICFKEAEELENVED